MDRVLCLGNNTIDTDTKTRQLSEQQGIPCYGLLSEIERPITEDLYDPPGFYHSSIYDVSFGNLVRLANQFDLVIMLDQPKDQWSHPDAFYNTIRLMKSIDQPIKFQDDSFATHIDFFEELVESNKSFCIFPFIELLAHGSHSTVCCRSTKPVAAIDQIDDFSVDKNYQTIRQKMLDGQRIPEHCGACYRLEDLGMRSARQQETVEWANRLSLGSLDDLKKIAHPVYYEIRASNKCNLQCRMCNPSSSHLIDEEYRRIGIISKDSLPTRSYDYGFDLIDFTNLKKLYVAGGEPLIMPEFYYFLDRCIAESNTDFEFLINTNGTKLSEKLKKQIAHFSNLQFIFSIDGYDSLNHYIRWPSDWKTIIENFSYLRENKRKVIINTTVSIYNIANLDRLFGFIDERFPNTLIHIRPVESPSILSPWLYPDRQKVVDSLERIKVLSCYHNDQLFSNNIDSMILKFKSLKNETPNLEKFFSFNDKLDQSRSIELKDYLPELESYRI